MIAVIYIPIWVLPAIFLAAMLVWSGWDELKKRMKR